MRARYPLLQFALLTILLSYGFIGGLTESGLRNPAYLLLTQVLLAGIVVLWLAQRTIQHWTWHPSPLDLGWLLLAAATGIAWLANQDASRRIIIGVVYVGICIGLWTIVWDGMSNRRLRLAVLIDSLLVASLTTVGVSLVQIWQLATTGNLRRILDTGRISGLLDNPNFAGGFLIIALALAGARWLSVRSRPGRLMVGGYILVALLLLLASGSRGAWLSAAAGLTAGVLIGLIAVGSNELRSRWAALTAASRRWLTIVAAVGALSVLALVVFAGVLMSARTGSDDLRGGVFRAALQMTAEKPLTGYGLWTFGRELARFESIPPAQGLPVPHNFILNAAAELGLIGLAALGVAIIMLSRSVARTVTTRAVDEDSVLRKGAAVALILVGIHHLFDQPLTASPVLAVSAVLVAAMAAAPPRATARQRFSIIPALLGVGWLLMLGLGLWHYGTYRQYFAALQLAAQQRTEEAVGLLRGVMEADPHMPMYAMAKGYLLGTTTTDDSQLAEAISALEQLTRQEPYYAPGWMNLGALYRRAGRAEQALQAVQQAAIYAPDAWQVHYLLGEIAEFSEDTALATSAYRRALDLSPDVRITEDWSTSSTRRQFSIDAVSVSRPARVIDLLRRGDMARAAEIWAGADSTDRQFPGAALIEMAFALERGDREAASQRLTDLKNAPQIGETRLWVRLGEIWLMRVNGDSAAADSALDDLRREAAALRLDDRLDAITYSQYRVIGTGITFLPDIYTLNVSPSLMRMLSQ